MAGRLDAQLYRASLDAHRDPREQVVVALRTVLALGALLWVALAAPMGAPVLVWMRDRGVPQWCVDVVVHPLTLVARGCLLLEVVGYTYHRFVHHLGWLTPRSAFARHNQRLHWIHHMVQYPVGERYERAGAYLSANGSTLTWLPPYLLTLVAIVALHGVGQDAVLLVAALMAYAALVNLAHARFHLARDHSRTSRYLRWIADVHRLHHWDQRCNFTIAIPVLDIACGTYRSPRDHAEQLRQTTDASGTASDLINWRYLVEFAATAEQRAYISGVDRGVPEEAVGVLDVLGSHLAEQPDDHVAAEMLARVKGCLDTGGIASPRGSVATREQGAQSARPPHNA